MPLRVFFGFFLLAKQKKETRMSRDSDYLNATIFSVITQTFLNFVMEFQYIRIIKPFKQIFIMR